jgi:uncharacterized protein (DUF2062 family)
MIHLTKAALKQGLEKLLHTHDTPERTAAAYAIGVFWGFSPPLGLHTILGLACAFAFNLNRVAVILGVYSNLPWIIVPYYMLATGVGAAIIRADLPPGLMNELRALLENFSFIQAERLLTRLAPFLWSFVVGTTIGAFVLSLVAYRTALAFVLAHRRHSARVQARKPPISGI